MILKVNKSQFENVCGTKAVTIGTNAFVRYKKGVLWSGVIMHHRSIQNLCIKAAFE